MGLFLKGNLEFLSLHRFRVLGSISCDVGSEDVTRTSNLTGRLRVESLQHSISWSLAIARGNPVDIPATDSCHRFQSLSAHNRDDGYKEIFCKIFP